MGKRQSVPDTPVVSHLPPATTITYWWIRGPHCAAAKEVRQVSKMVNGRLVRGDIAYVCTHSKETQL